MILHRAKNGLECMNMIKSDTYDLIFLDLNMPIKNGLDCLKFIESQEPPITAPVIIYSTSHYLRDIDASFKLGARYYIIKPADANQLPDVLTDVFTRIKQYPRRADKESFVVGLESNSQLY